MVADDHDTRPVAGGGKSLSVTNAHALVGAVLWLRVVPYLSVRPHRVFSQASFKSVLLQNISRSVRTFPSLFNLH